MQPLPRKLYTAEQVRELDQLAINKFKIPGFTLMTRAGEVVYDTLVLRYPQAKNIVVICGTGNNGGDGFVVARLIRSLGRQMQVSVFLVGDESRIEGDALSAFDTLDDCDVEVHAYQAGCMKNADVIVDALFGTGLTREVSGEALQAIQEINRLQKPVLAIDVPSGLSANTGMPMGAAVRADATVTFIGLKRGLFTGEGPDHSGEIIFSDLSVPAEIFASIESAARRIDTDSIHTLLPARRRSSHKGNFGHVLVIGGNEGFIGAVILCATAALRTGAGLVSVATRSAHAALIAVAQPELMAHACEDAHSLDPLIKNASVIAIGPGLGQDEWAQSMLKHAFAKDLPLVVDADALNLLAKNPQARTHWVITPHPGEAARLLGVDTKSISTDRFRSAQELHKSYMATTVLKGCGSIICSEGRSPALCSQGNPGMATGGTGDILTGVIASLIAQGLTCADAAEVGVCLHAQAGDKAAARRGERGMIAGDLLEFI